MSLARALVPLVVAPLAGAQDRSQQPYLMDYGPVISTTVRGEDDGNVALKGRVIRLGERAGVVFDTELLRVAAAWTDGDLILTGTPFDGAHGPIPYAKGMLSWTTPQAPGWAGAEGSFSDPRPISFGPLPHDHARWRGHYLHGDDVVLRYRVGARDVLERFAVVTAGGQRAVVRSLELGRSTAAATARVLTAAGATPAADGPNRVSMTKVLPAPDPTRSGGYRAEEGWEQLPFDAPSALDWADVRAGHGATVRWVEGFAAPSRDGPQQDPRALPRLLDGHGATDRDAPPECVWFDGGDARLHMDLGAVIEVTRVSTFSRHVSDRAPLRFELFASDAEAADPAAADPAAAGWRRLGAFDTRQEGGGGFHGASAGAVPGGSLGRYRHLLWHLRKPSRPHGSFLTEIDVWAGDARAACDAEPVGDPVTWHTAVALGAHDTGFALSVRGEDVLLHVPPSADTTRCELVVWAGDDREAGALGALVAAAGVADDLAALTHGGPRRWGAAVETAGALGSGQGAWVVDTVTVPDENPWHSRLRFGAFDFVGPHAAVLSTWNGDVWRVDGIDADLDRLVWRRIATGLHDPLGLKVVGGVIHTHGRDQISRLHDLNGDGEIDFYECFNNDVLITRSFHEFAFDLQTDAEGNFYFSKGAPVRPGGRGFDRIVPHHGTILKLANDGSRLEVFSTGHRAPNGIGVSPDGIVTSGDNEGTWMPKCRLNYLRQPGGFCGVKDTAHRTPVPEVYDDPLCWLPMYVDNSSGGQVWVTSDRWGPLQGELLHQSYGQSSLYLVLRQEEPDRVQGGVVRIPVSFASSQMRGRFHDADGQLYAVGFKGWQTNAVRDTAFERVRYTGAPVRLPVGMRITAGTIELDFLVELDAETATDAEGYGVEIWNYVYSEAYGSAEYSLLHPERKVEKGQPNRDALAVTAAELVAGGKRVVLHVDGLRRAMQVRIAYSVDSARGELVEGEIHGTINFLGDSAASRR